jgi:hypothetical protein
MEVFKKVFFVSVSAVSVIFGCLYAKEAFQKSKSRSDLECYYARELEEVYTKGYAVDQKGQRVCGQSQFEAGVQKVEEQMLKEGFNREEIRQMKDEGRRKGQETRRLWDQISSQEKQEHKAVSENL